MKLYEIVGMFNDVVNYIEQAETPEEIEGWREALESVNISYDEKVENIVKYIKNLEADVEAYKKEEARFKAKKQTTEKKIESLKDYLFGSMEYLGKEKIILALFTVSIRNNPESVNVLDEASIPKKYFIKQEPKLDKGLIKQAIQSGHVVKGAELIRKRSLQIK